MSEVQNARLATLVALAEKRPGLGRTAFMKLSYFLQALRNVPLAYRFTLYSYGPFDSSVLSDLASAEVLGALHSELRFYPSGYGYEIVPTERSGSVKALARDFIQQHDADISWVIGEFAMFGSADLELLGTIVYVDQEFARINESLTVEKLAQRVLEIKPHFKESYISSKVADLYSRGLLRSLAAANPAAVGRPTAT